jgi:hypothetical protein
MLERLRLLRRQRVEQAERPGARPYRQGQRRRSGGGSGEQGAARKAPALIA